MRTLRMALVGGFAGALMAGNVATLHAAPLPTNEASMKSRGPTVRSSSGGRGGHKCVRRILKERRHGAA